MDKESTFTERPTRNKCRDDSRSPQQKAREKPQRSVHEFFFKQGAIERCRHLSMTCNSRFIHMRRGSEKINAPVASSRSTLPQTKSKTDTLFELYF